MLQSSTQFPKNPTINDPTSQTPIKDIQTIPQLPIGQNVPRKDKITFLVNSLTDILDNNKEAVYSTLDAWVAWERDFPIGALKNVILALEKENQWHRIIHVIKWMLSKGQGTTRGTYGQLIEALDKDHRFDEANDVWKRKLGFDLHSVPWKLCKLMISVYYRNKKFEELVRLFEGLEGFDRKPPERSIVQKVADAYEMLGLLEEKGRVVEKYKDLFDEKLKRKMGRARSAHNRKPGQKK
ncbi:pentatricopeptide repeat-containing protein at4g18975 chloroplastic [Phtheirospermum japonicum]|uniref:Pentatricopeptide repeat-containing protein at4g18975 chloroplastic n=1 Tax=Phtheirospermum japonicum TaxID=374723 RepID=A0A830CLB5_9LAMI|nr:pentatricopeptide repeat-containing protein at4g18975 chloroplastic [Phtheirospermum japonicum]